MRGPLTTVFIGLAALLAAAACAAPYGESDEKIPRVLEQDSRGTDPADSDAPPPAAPMRGPSSAGGGGGNSDAGSDTNGDASPADPAACPGSATPSVPLWKSPPPVSSACSNADITYFAQVAANQTWLGVESLMRTRNSACAKCIFNKDTDATWHAVVYVGTGGDAFVNTGGCFVRAAGGSEACGKNVSQWADCYAEVCDGTACGTQAALDACYDTERVTNACLTYNPVSSCGGETKYLALDNVCTSYVDVARVMCAGGS